MQNARNIDTLLPLIEEGLPVKTDSRKVQAGDVFVAMPGANVRGAIFIEDAIKAGAAVVVTSDKSAISTCARKDVVFIYHENPALALGEMACAFFGTKDCPMDIVGVTGTNGKTTTTYITEHLLTAAGKRVGVLGTVSYRWPGEHIDAPLTTPDCWQTHEMLSRMMKAGVDTVLMEVSSHALDQHRVAGIDFKAAVLMNLTQDHLDYHETMEQYFEAKASLFLEYPAKDKAAIICSDDEWGQRLLSMDNSFTGFGIGSESKVSNPVLHGDVLSMDSNGLGLLVRYGSDEWKISSPLIGKHNALNLLAAQGIGLALGLTPADMQSLSEFNGVPGRLERIPDAHGRHVFVDYAHTPDALINVQRTLAELDFEKLFVLFGCGGNRDRAKRPLMAKAVAQYADVAILTSDNPRHEDPQEIITDARPGLFEEDRKPQIIEEVDRKKAIYLAVANMQPGDVLLIAGKGHETYQDINGTKLDFNDGKIVAEALSEVHA
ncbi:MAG: UDP-N-acetylmuramoyl-L-alanyl-D-glutamate--2,6-diaminopimelate ligase [Desulfovibrio sp.]